MKDILVAFAGLITTLLVFGIGIALLITPIVLVVKWLL